MIVAIASVAVLLSALLTAWLARRVRARAQAVGSPESGPLDVVSETRGPTSGSPARAPREATDEVSPAVGDEAPDVRALRAQVRVLEMALSETRAADTDARSTGLVHRRRVDATIRGLARVTTADEPQEQRVLRTLAAIERLDAPAGFTRPVLSPVAPSLLTNTGTDAPAGPQADAALRADAGAGASVQTADEAAAEAPADFPAAEASAAEVTQTARPVTVLPIPPLEMPDQGRRSRTRRRPRARAS